LAEKGPAEMSKRLVPAASPELPLLERTRAPARIGLGASTRDLGFFALSALSVVWCWQPFTTVIVRSLSSEEHKHYSHIILLPLVSAYLLYVNRHAILQHARPRLRPGILLVAIGATIVGLGRTGVSTVDPEYRLSLAMLGLVMLWMGGFVLCYGLRALRTGLFPFALLLLMIPLPPVALTVIIRFLQKTSADASALLFGVVGMPFFRDGFSFALPGLTILVAPECSGIRSSLALLISGLVMAYLFLRATWTRVALVLVIIPLAIVKNAVRIVVLSWLAVHIDPSFVTGSALHEKGGIPLFLISLTILGAIAWFLRRHEELATR
jgi:exosortase